MSRGLVLLLAVTALVLLPLVGAGFVWDDPVLIAHNTWTASWADAGRAFTGSLWGGVPDHEGGGAFYRPLMLLSLTLDRQLFDLEPAGYHLHSIAWHLAAVALLWRLLRGLAPRGALVGAALYALHPLQTEAVAFIAARNDSMAVVGLLGAWLLLAEREVSLLRLVLAAALALGALLSKETAIIALPGLLVLDLARFGRSRPGQPSGAPRYLALLAAAAAWWALRSLADLDAASTTVEPEALFKALLKALSWDLGLLVNPRLGSPAQVLSQAAPSPALAALSLAALIGLTSISARKIEGEDGGRWVGFAGLALGALGLAPALAGAAVSDSLAHRYLTLPLVGASLLLAAAAHRSLAGEGRRPQLLSAALAGALALLLGVSSALALPAWSSNTHFWEDALARSPSTHSACGLFKAREHDDDPARAAEALRLAVRSPPSQYCCLSASRWALDRAGPEVALAVGEAALTQGCAPSPELLAPIALSAALTGRWEEAEAKAARLGGDPYGYVPVVLSAAALRRGDDTVLRTWAAERPDEDAAALKAQVSWLLEQAP